VTKTCSQFTTDEAAYKLLYLAICDIQLRTTSRGGNKEKKLLQRGSDTQHRTEALNHLAILFPGDSRNRLTRQFNTGMKSPLTQPT
jgi:hypothetical protein